MRYKRGLTLTELLFVIAIVALLAALLFPVLMTARSKARQAVCASHLRQLALAMRIYTQDHNGWFSDYDWKWPYELSPYLKLSLPIPEAMFKPYNRPTGILQCPERPIRGLKPPLDYWTLFPTVSYALNAAYSHYCTCWRPTMGAQLGLVNICGPANQNWEWLIDAPNIVLFVDRAVEKGVPIGDNVFVGPSEAPIVDPNPDLISVHPCYPYPPADKFWPFYIYFNNPHQGGTNTAFVDGHVKWMLPDKLNERTSTGLLKWFISFKLP